MVNRILWSAAITLALTFSPNLSLAVPTKTVKKKASKPQENVAKKSKSSKSSKTSRSRSSRSRSEDVVESSMVPSSTERRTVTDTAPLMKVTPNGTGNLCWSHSLPRRP